MTFKAIKDFLALIRNSSLRKDTHIRITLDDAQKIQTEIGILLLELQEKDKTAQITTFDGGNFK